MADAAETETVKGAGVTPGTGIFLNDGGLVNEIFEDGGDCSFDIFDASIFAGSEDDGQAYAALITRAVNSHDDLYAALELAESWVWQITDETLEGEGTRPDYVAACEQISTALAAAREPKT